MDLLSNLNNAIISLVHLDFKVSDLKTGIIQTRLDDTICHFLGKNIKGLHCANTYENGVISTNLISR